MSGLQECFTGEGIAYYEITTHDEQSSNLQIDEEVSVHINNTDIGEIHNLIMTRLTARGNRGLIMGKTRLVSVVICIFLLASLSSCRESNNSNVKTEAPISTVSVIETDGEIGEQSETIDMITKDEQLLVVFDLIYDYEYWDLYDWTDGPYPTQKIYEASVDDMIDSITQYLGKEDWLIQYAGVADTVYLKLTISSTRLFGQISMPKQYTMNTLVFDLGMKPEVMTGESGKSPLLHELVHLITYDNELERHAISLELNDGLCEYVSYALGSEEDFTILRNNNPLDYLFANGDIDSATEEEKIAFREVIDNLGKESVYYQYDLKSREWSYSYVLNAFFVKYIIETYGVEDFLEIHDPSGNESETLKKLQRLQQMKTEWLDLEVYDAVDFTAVSEGSELEIHQGDEGGELEEISTPVSSDDLLSGIFVCETLDDLIGMFKPDLDGAYAEGYAYQLYTLFQKESLEIYIDKLIASENYPYHETINMMLFYEYYYRGEEDLLIQDVETLIVNEDIENEKMVILQYFLDKSKEPKD